MKIEAGKVYATPKSTTLIHVHEVDPVGENKLKLIATLENKLNGDIYSPFEVYLVNKDAIQHWVEVPE